MQSTIAPTIRADDQLREHVERADRALRQDIHELVEGLTWAWAPGGGAGPSVTLTVSYGDNLGSRTFTVNQLVEARDVVWAARELWESVVVSNILRTADRIVDLLREMEREELLQGA